MSMAGWRLGALQHYLQVYVGLNWSSIAQTQYSSRVNEAPTAFDRAAGFLVVVRRRRDQGEIGNETRRERRSLGNDHPDRQIVGALLQPRMIRIFLTGRFNSLHREPRFGMIAQLLAHLLSGIKLIWSSLKLWSSMLPEMV